MKAILIKLGLLGGGLAAGLVLLEVLLRFAGISHPDFYQYDYDLGGTLRPGAQGWWTREGRVYIRVSPEGLRDKSYPLKKGKGVFRIAVLGDSFAEAFQVEEQEAFWSVMEKELAHCRALEGRAVEAINFGVSGYGTAQAWRMLQTRAWDYSPDLVLLAFTVGNDVHNNSKEIDSDPIRPFYRYEGDALVRDDSFRENLRYIKGTQGLRPILAKLRGYSRTLQVVYRIKDVLHMRREMKKTQDKVTEKPLIEAGLGSDIYMAPEKDALKDAWRVTEGMLAGMKQEATARGVSFWMMLVTNAGQVGPRREERLQLAQKLGVPNLAYPNARLKRWGAAQGFGVIDLVPSFVARAEKEGVYFHGFSETELGRGHWNAHGHRLAGEVTADALCRSFSKRADVTQPSK